MTDLELIDKLGGNSEIARLLNIKPPSVTYWRKKGIPELRRRQLKDLRPEIFDVQTEDPNPATEGA